IVARIGAEFPLEPVPPAYPGEVANRWRYLDGSGEIGVIASVTKPFCGSCTRARLSAEGRLYTCLFAAEGHDLRGLVRGGAGDDAVERELAYEPEDAALLQPLRGHRPGLLDEPALAPDRSGALPDDPELLLRLPERRLQGEVRVRAENAAGTEDARDLRE